MGILTPVIILLIAMTDLKLPFLLLFNNAMKEEQPPAWEDPNEVNPVPGTGETPRIGRKHLFLSLLLPQCFLWILEMLVTTKASTEYKIDSLNISG